MSKPHPVDNPFRFGQILHTAESYCPRPELEAQVASTARGSGRLVIYGPRRMGKSSLAVHGLQEAEEFYVHVDAMAVSSADEFARRFSEAYDRALASHGMKGRAKGWFEAVKDALRSVQVSLNLAHVGASVAMEKKENGTGLVDVLKVIEKHSRSERVTIFIDEVQDLMGMKPEDTKQVLGVLRSQLQLQGRTAYIFSGSSAPSMTQLFEDPRGPFYGVAAPLRVGPIPPKAFLTWIGAKFAEGDRPLPGELAPLLIEIAGAKPNDVQRLCSAIWEVSKPGDRIGMVHLRRGLESIMASVGESGQSLLRQVRPNQRRALVALAHIGSNLSSETLRDLGFRNESEFEKQIAPFLERTNPVLERSENRIVFSNPFLRAWIASRSELAVVVPEPLRRSNFAANLLGAGEPAPVESVRPVMMRRKTRESTAASHEAARPTTLVMQRSRARMSA